MYGVLKIMTIHTSITLILFCIFITSLIFIFKHKNLIFCQKKNKFKRLERKKTRKMVISGIRNRRFSRTISGVIRKGVEKESAEKVRLDHPLVIFLLRILRIRSSGIHPFSWILWRNPEPAHSHHQSLCNFPRNLLLVPTLPEEEGNRASEVKYDELPATLSSDKFLPFPT